MRFEILLVNPNLERILQPYTENLASIGSFGVAYMSVVLVEPLVDLAVLAAAKTLHRLKGSLAVEPRLHSAA